MRPVPSVLLYHRGDAVDRHIDHCVNFSPCGGQHGAPVAYPPERVGEVRLEVQHVGPVVCALGVRVAHPPSGRHDQLHVHASCFLSHSLTLVSASTQK